MKKKILFCSEASYLNTGYATYSREILRRLHASGKYEIAEFASYGKDGDPRIASIPWRFYPNTPADDDREGHRIYGEEPVNQFGAWRFDAVALDFKPDIVCDIRDFWMIEHQQKSTFRDFFSWVIMPTVDAAPQNEQWIDTFASADYVLNYSDWGYETLVKESNNRINCVGSACPSADMAYQPIEDKQKHRESLGFSSDIKIIGTVMRNQRRKLFPDLFEAFAKFLEKPNSEKTYLYCHTSFPDLGWDLPKIINRYGLSSKVLMTYVCPRCKHAFPSFFQDAFAKCTHCGFNDAVPANVQHGVSYEFLSSIMNTFDLYVQYANSEGFGLPQVEAAGCGIPVASIDYSAMSSVVRKLEGYPIPLKSTYIELETGCERAVPDNDAAAQIFSDFFGMSSEERDAKSKKTRDLFEKHYQWDKTCKKWESVFDAIEAKPHSTTWESASRIFHPLDRVPPNMSNREYARWLIINVLGMPSKLDSYMESRLIRDLNYGVYIEGTGNEYFNEDSWKSVKPQYAEFDRNTAYQMLYEMREKFNQWESRRLQNVR